MAKIDVALLVGEQSKQWLADLTVQIDRLESLSLEGAGKLLAPKVEPEEVEDEAPAPKKGKAKKAPNGFDDEKLSEEPDEDEEEFLTAPKKAPKITIDSVNDAAKNKARETSRATVLGILKKHFKTESISELKPEQYAKCVELLS